MFGYFLFDLSGSTEDEFASNIETVQHKKEPKI